MPSRCRLLRRVEGVGLCMQVLRVVLPEVDQARRERVVHDVDPEALRHCDERDGVGVAPGACDPIAELGD